MRLRRVLKRVMSGCVNAMAMIMVTQTANSACVWIVHQPKFPKEADKFKKKKKNLF